MINIAIAAEVQKLINDLPRPEDLSTAPRVWNQGDWCYTQNVGENHICQTAACVAGWIVILDGESKGVEMADTVKLFAGSMRWDDEANKILGLEEDHIWLLTDDEGEGLGPFYLYGERNDLEDVNHILRRIIVEGTILNQEEEKRNG